MITIVTRQNLLAEKTRFLISVGGIALAVFLISFLLSLFQGWRLTVGRFVERVDADVWVAREGTTDFLNAASILPADMQAGLAEIEGVEDVDALIVRPMEVTIEGDAQGMHLVGYEADGAGGPLEIKGDRGPPGEGEMIVDEAFENKAGVGVGDVIETSGQQVEVVGTSTGGNLIFSQTTFVSIETARSVLSMDGLSTFYLVHLAPDANATAVASETEQRFPDVSAFTGDEFATATRDRILRNIIPILIVILFLSFVVGVAITGLTIYNATVEKQREFGILKAIGFTNGYLFRLVLEQSMITGLLGFVIGAGLTIIAAQFISDVVPQFVTLLRWQDIAAVLGTTLLMAVTAALLPVRRIANVDPVAVFAG